MTCENMVASSGFPCLDKIGDGPFGIFQAAAADSSEEDRHEEDATERLWRRTEDRC